MSSSLKGKKHKRTRRQRLTERKVWLQEELNRVSDTLQENSESLEDEAKHSDDVVEIPECVAPTSATHKFFQWARGWFQRLVAGFQRVVASIPAVSRVLGGAEKNLDKLATQIPAVLYKVVTVIGTAIAGVLLRIRQLISRVRVTALPGLDSVLRSVPLSIVA